MYSPFDEASNSEEESNKSNPTTATHPNYTIPYPAYPYRTYPTYYYGQYYGYPYPYQYPPVHNTQSIPPQVPNPPISSPTKPLPTQTQSPNKSLQPNTQPKDVGVNALLAKLEAEARNKKIKKPVVQLQDLEMEESNAPLNLNAQNLLTKRKVMDNGFNFEDRTSNKKQRVTRFQNNVSNMNGNYSSSPPVLPKGKIIGTCTIIEKEYYRMQETDPSKIRPEYILKQALAHFEDLWKKGNMEYLAVCNQIKSIRQDLTVQQIKNEFTVKVYETHARIALESEDFSEFNQCQTQLRILYEVLPNQPNEMEFTAYRILYKLIDGDSVLLNVFQCLSESQRTHPYVEHAISLCSAYYSRNFFKFFKLYQTTPNIGKKVIYLYLSKVRGMFLKSLSKSYHGPLDINWISNLLAFNNNDECKNFMRLEIIRKNGIEQVNLKKFK